VELEQAIKHRIVQRTGGRIRMLEVEVIGSRVVINGCAPCYYLKQLALQGVLDVIGPVDIMQIELDVQLLVNPPRLDAEVD
jgi:hypothetical protein